MVNRASTRSTVTYKIYVNADKEVRVVVVCEAGAVIEADALVGIARYDHVRPSLFQERPQLPADAQRNRLLVEDLPARFDRASIGLAAVARVDDNDDVPHGLAGPGPRHGDGNGNSIRPALDDAVADHPVQLND